MLTTIAPGRVPEHRQFMTTSPVPIPPPPPTSPSLPSARDRLQVPPGLHGWSRAVESALVVNMVWAAVSTGFLFAQSALFEHFGGSTLVASVPDLVDEQ